MKRLLSIFNIKQDSSLVGEYRSQAIMAKLGWIQVLVPCFLGAVLLVCFHAEKSINSKVIIKWTKNQSEN